MIKMGTYVISLAANGCAQTQVGSLWREYEAGTSPEALLVKDFDKLEMIIQVRV
jgi:putative hydrolase of HD superfamily